MQKNTIGRILLSLIISSVVVAACGFLGVWLTRYFQIPKSWRR